MAAIIDQIPAMSDEQLDNLRRNATRLSGEGAAKSRAKASEVLSAVEQQIRTRAEAKEAADAARRRATLDKARAAPRKPRVPRKVAKVGG